jgi:hypothetical protein
MTSREKTITAREKNLKTRSKFLFICPSVYAGQIRKTGCVSQFFIFPISPYIIEARKNEKIKKCTIDNGLRKKTWRPNVMCHFFKQFLRVEKIKKHGD